MIELNPSMMCASFSNLEKEVTELDAAGADVFHIDLMDGHFVDSFGMGYQDMKFIREATKKRMEIHLMVENPLNYLEALSHLGVDIIYIHPEAERDPGTVLEKIHKHGISPGIAINPGTSIAYVEELFNWVDRVLVMCVNPGHAGRQFVPYVIPKVERLIALGERFGFDVIWDGSATFPLICEYAKKGVKGFVLGTSVLFGKDKPYDTIIRELRKEIE